MLAVSGCISPGTQGTVTPTVPAPVSPSPAPPGPTPAPVPPSPTSGSGGTGAITVARPVPGEEIRSPVRVQGTASVFEANVQLVVKNARGESVGQGFTTATAAGPERGDYTASVAFTLTGGRQNGAVEVFSPSPRDGQPQHLVSVPVVLVP